MPLIFLILIMLCSGHDFDLHKFLANWFLPLHGDCLSLLPTSEYPELLSGLICGKALPATSTAQNLQAMGLTHLIVVSGAHLTWIEGWLRLLLKNRFQPLLGLLLVFYCGVTQLQPPVVRGLMEWVTRGVCERLRLSWNREIQVLLSLLLCWLFEPDWITSLSLLLSWIATLGLAIAEEAHVRGLLFRQCWMSLALLPALSSLSGVSLGQVILASYLSPILGSAILPLGAIALVCSPLIAVHDALWSICFAIFGAVPDSWFDPLQFHSMTRPELWAYSLGLLFMLTFVRLKSLRRLRELS